MRALAVVMFMGGLLAATSLTSAQPPGGNKGGRGGGKGGGFGGGKAATAEELVAQMMAFDANKDGKLTKDEVTDQRLSRLFDRADANKDGVVTREELTALFTKEMAAGGGFGGPGGPRGGGFGGPGGFGPPQPGQILPPFLQTQLDLTDAQKKQVESLQKDVDAKLDRILTADQKKALQEMRQRGPGGPGGPGGFGPPGGGPGGPGGGRPGGPGGNQPPKQP